jgi:NAD(P)H-dependent FMN reductase
MMRALIFSTGLASGSRSELLAAKYGHALSSRGVESRIASLKEYPLPPFDNGSPLMIPSYLPLHELVSGADALVLASPVYNWGLSAELKRFVEIVGSTPPNNGIRGAFFDKIVTFVCAAGLPHSYMAFTPLAMSMVLDFKCILNPYNVYVHNRHWEGETLGEEATERINQSAAVLAELMKCLAARTYRSSWDI